MSNMRSTSGKMKAVTKYYGDTKNWTRQKGRQDWSYDRNARKCGGTFKERVVVINRPPRG